MIERLVLRFLRWRNGRRHRRRLARIEVLERELFPELFKLRAILPPKQEWLEDLATAPGARWLVESHNYVQVFRDPIAAQMKALAEQKNIRPWHPSVVAENLQHVASAERSGLTLSPEVMLQRALAMAQDQTGQFH